MRRVRASASWRKPFPAPSRSRASEMTLREIFLALARTFRMKP